MPFRFFIGWHSFITASRAELTKVSRLILISPKDLIKIHRIKKALNYQLTCEESLTQMAYHLKYYDQAHFSKDFKDSTGISPKQYFLNSKLSSDFSEFQHWSYDNFENVIK
jgi:AraC-like DNA-binding protein